MVIDTTVLPEFTTKTNKPGVVENDDTDRIYAGHINTIQDYVKVWAAKVGVDGSAVQTSLTYLLTNAASVDPGHRHSEPASMGQWNVADYGALGDNATDDTAAIQACIDAMPTTKATLYIPYGANGVYRISDTIRFRDTQRCRIIMAGGVIAAMEGSDFNGKPLLDVCGSNYLYARGLDFDSRDSDNYPVAAMVTGRTNDNPGGAQTFEACQWQGHYTLATVYNASAEVISFVHCVLQSEEVAVPTYFDTSNDDVHNLTNSLAASNTRKSFRNCDFLQYGIGSTQATVITLEGGCSEIDFESCFASIGTTGTGIVFLLIPAAGMTNDATNFFTIDGLRVEGSIGSTAGSRLIDHQKTNGGIEWDIRGVVWTIPSDYLIKLRTDLVASKLSLGFGGSATKLIEVVGGAFARNQIDGVLCSANVGRITVTAPGSEAGNIVNDVSNGGYPFAGSGIADSTDNQGDVVISSQSFGGSISVATIRQRTSAFTANDTTPRVAGFSKFKTANSSDTLITGFDFGTFAAVPGHKFVVRVTDTHTAFQHSSGLKLRGSVNWFAPINAEITFLYDDDSGGVFQEIARTDPSAGAFRNASADYTMTDADETVFVDSSVSAKTITLPLAANRMGKTFIITKAGTGSNAVNVVPTGADTVNGGASLTTSTLGATFRMKSNGGTGWWTV